MIKLVDTDALLKRLIAKGSQAPLTEIELAQLYKLLHHYKSLQNAETTNSTRLTLQKQLTDALTQAENLATQLEDRQLALADSQAENKTLRRALNDILNSSSWKLSAPLRKAINTLRKPSPIDTFETKNETIVKLNTNTAQTTPDSRALITDREIVYSPKVEAAPLSNTPAKLFAFYLPQFHAIPENSEWWGDGFTEWMNVRPASPLYDGHHQPHVPDPKAGLGYYDLTDPSIMPKQIELAKLYGIEGFCFYFYWFAGKRLLESPLLALLENENLDIPFCLCWANENWSRRWDGLDSEILIAQDHSAEDDIAFISYISKYLTDPRYRKVNGKPLLMVYRPIELPDANATAKRWRKWCRENGVGEIYIAYTQSFEDNDPREYGFDGAVEFPPNNAAPPNITDQVTPLSEDFTGIVYDWDIFPQRSDNYAQPDYPLFRTVCPSWDNTARRKQNGTVFANSTPARYKHWLSNAIADSCSRIDNIEDRLIFVNAWNEWAEGAHLEPDAAHGYAYLNATRQALIEAGAQTERRIVLVSHDAYPHGAQFLTLNMARTLKEDFGYHIDLIVLGDGSLFDEFSNYAVVHKLAGLDPAGDAAKALAKQLFLSGANTAICNTTVSGLYAATLKKCGFHVISLIHELKDVIRDNGLEQHADAICAHADKIVFPAPLVANSFKGFTGPLGDKEVLRSQGAYKINRFRSAQDRKTAQTQLRQHLGLNKSARIMLGVGYADHRKGFDLFLDAAEALNAAQPNVVSVWLGHHDMAFMEMLQTKVDALIERGALLLPGRVQDTDIYYAGADVFLLTSREDPYPSTVLEALDVGLVTVGFEGATGTTELITQHKGALVPLNDAEALVAATQRALLTAGPRQRTQIAQMFRARPDVSFKSYVHDLLGLAGLPPAQVSAIVPNYNYAHFMPERVASITEQSLPVRELIILDDGSSDDSLNVIDQIMSGLNLPTKLIADGSNSGSVFLQWLKGVEAARSEYVWIAEADDLAAPDFLKSVMAGFSGENVVMSYSQSKQMAENGDILCDTYLDYTHDVSASRWRKPYTAKGQDEIAQALSVKNTIPNVSGVVFKRKPLLHVLRTHMEHVKSFRVAGDWSVYVNLLKDGDIAFTPKALNYHRRHDHSVTLQKFSQNELDEITRMQAYAAQQAKVSGNLSAKARAYAEELRQQFGLPLKHVAE
ncbi:MAG: glycoside hydrolase family 99-like domain-containing protein [Maricaulaceae bacterium]